MLTASINSYIFTQPTENCILMGAFVWDTLELPGCRKTGRWRGLQPRDRHGYSAPVLKCGKTRGERI